MEGPLYSRRVSEQPRVLVKHTSLTCLLGDLGERLTEVQAPVPWARRGGTTQLVTELL
jgi:hypothetical protein